MPAAAESRPRHLLLTAGLLLTAVFPRPQVGLDLFNFMQSFGNVTQVGSDQILVPTRILDFWFERLSSKLRRDPDFLTRVRDKV
jgi:hypothetical protein